MTISRRFNINKHIFVVFGLSFFLTFTALAQDSAHTVVGEIDLEKIQQETGAPASTINTIKNTLTGSVIKPEITVPANGGLLSGKNLLFKGIASPSSNIDILIQSMSQSTNSLTGKTTSDQYGVWSYTLSSELNPGSYSAVVSSQSPDSTPLQSAPISFSIQTIGQVSSNNTSGIFQSISDQPLVIVILAIIFCITLIIVTLIWAVVLYLHSVQKAKAINAMNQWDIPVLGEVDERQWQAFIDNLENLHRGFNPKRPSISAQIQAPIQAQIQAPIQTSIQKPVAPKKRFLFRAGKN